MHAVQHMHAHGLHMHILYRHALQFARASMHQIVQCWTETTPSPFILELLSVTAQAFIFQTSIIALTLVKVK